MYDLIIIGAGPAGLTASIYACCYKLSHLVIGSSLGGQLIFAPDILNYPGFVHISGTELTERMMEQVKMRGGEIIRQSVTSIANCKLQIGLSSGISGFEIETQQGGKYQTRSIILATGTERRKLNVPGEREYTAKGVHYCATCEKLDYAGKICAIAGGANSAVQAAVQLSAIAQKVYLIYRGDTLRGDPVWLTQIENNKNIEILYNTVITEIVGDGEKVTGVKISNLKTQNIDSPIDSNINNLIKELKLDKIFIEIGGVPGTSLVVPLGVEMDEGGYIKVNARLATNIPGIFAAGDLVSYGLSIEQISSAVGLGARAAASVFAYIKKDKTPTVWGESQIRR